MRNVITRLDPRYYQIAVLSLLVLYGSSALGFGIRPENAALILVTAILTQWLASRASGLAGFDPLSPIITSLSLTLLFRTDMVMLAGLAALIAIGSKFVVRCRGKHVFNPANIAIVSLMLASDRAWISSGQWGSTTIATVLLVGLGLLVLTRARRAETTVFFLLGYAALLLARAAWLGDPLQIPLHQLQNGALLVFAFFMISDPMTTPNTALGRTLFALIVAVVGFCIQFVWYQPHGPVIALAFTAPLVPLIDFVLRGRRYEWRSRSPLPGQSQGVF